MPKIPQSHAQIILRDSARFPTEGSQCDASCAFYWCCANSKDFGECKGFLLLNHGNLDHIKRTYDKNIDEFIENSYQVIQRSLNDGVEINADVLLRNIDSIGKQFSKKQQSLPTSGFLAMVEASRGIERSTEEEKQEEPTSEFQKMFIASRESREQRHTATLTRGIDESQFPDMCDPTKCPPDYARHCRANRQENWGKACIYKTVKNR